MFFQVGMCSGMFGLIMTVWVAESPMALYAKNRMEDA